MGTSRDLAYYQKKYKSYVQSLCVRYANQQSLSSADEIGQCAQEIQPLMNKLVSSIYQLVDYLSAEETLEIFNHLLTSDQKDFYQWMYNKYEYHLDNQVVSNTAARNILFYGLLLRDFYCGEIEKVANGGHVGPILLEITQRYLAEEPYENLCDAICFPIDELPYLCDSSIKSFINHCKNAQVPTSFNKEIFSKTILEHLEEIIATMDNLACADNDEKRAEQKDNIPENKTPLSWFQTPKTLKQDNKDPQIQRKKVSFAETPIIRFIQQLS